ncbi:3'(2'),5'-bisphosphate nucleotidase CysQ [Denitrificimonas sp. JX-1]|uniref:3'(2'),5'-bisphosphate nucleotidase CysQ n=1 Tax=Denitrificimonas halotolerans TaxID=3098930 RepID=A0ABU5GN92_9GAMM|nr:3'(2'),5'-bisphosphate nucleotidase CysQ [Denitrificimonas sp. JX-1]MDY7218408.1 3'(2'),5'-bisphosphate nucleotidase CysQ [Denitrificimonas sp. JX-1]
MMHPLVEPVLALVDAAGQATLAYWQADVAVDIKEDDSPVTAADMAAHRVLAAGLSELDANIFVLSEEDCEIPLAERQQWQRWWLVDPLDGTKEFISGTAEYTVNVALIEQGNVVFGVVGVPVTGEIYYGGAAFGAYCRDKDGNTRHLHMRRASYDELVVVASRRHTSPAQEALLDHLAHNVPALQLVNVGSSLKFCQMAEGAADFYPRLAPTSQWDTAAAQAVLEGAGGEVLNLQGQVLTYAAQVGYLNPFFVALPKQAPWREPFLEYLAQTQS